LILLLYHNFAFNKTANSCQAAARVHACAPAYQAGGNIHLLHVVFAGYLCLSTIILLNMLIAMMNSTYSMVRSTRATTWRVESLRSALWVERKLPFLKRSLFLHFDTQRRVVDDRPRWYIAYTAERVDHTVCMSTS
jgi:hypothetical protein